jgi:predicted transcriptional regulator
MAKPKKTPKSKKSPTDIALSIAVDPELKAKLAAIADREHRSISYIVRLAVEQYIASQPVAA